MDTQRSVWTQKRFLAYASGLAIDRLGNSVYSVVLPLVVYELTHSVLNMGAMAVVQFLPRAVCAIFIGALVDRMNRRTVIITALLFQGICSAAIALCYQFHVLELWMIYLAGACISVGFEFSRTAEIAVVPVMFAERRVEATAGLASIFTATLLMGPVLGAWMLLHADHSQLFWINAASYLAPVLLCGLSGLPREVHGQPLRTVSEVVASIREGASFLLGESSLTQLIRVVLIVGLATSGLQTVIIYYLKNQMAVSDSGVASFMAVGGLGMLAGSVWISRSGGVARGRLLRVCFGLIAAGVLMLLSQQIAVMLAAQFLLSAGLLAFGVVQDVVVQDRVPNHMLGRVGGFMRLLSHLSVSASAALSAVLVSVIGARGMFLVAAAIAAIAALVSLRTQFMTESIEQSSSAG